jgi:hypothetical protein
MTPDDAWLSPLETSSEGSRLNDVANGVLVANGGHEALNDTLGLVNTNLAITGFDLDICFHPYRHR